MTATSVELEKSIFKDRNVNEQNTHFRQQANTHFYPLHKTFPILKSLLFDKNQSHHKAWMLTTVKILIRQIN